MWSPDSFVRCSNQSQEVNPKKLLATSAFIAFHNAVLELSASGLLIQMTPTSDDPDRWRYERTQLMLL